MVCSHSIRRGGEGSCSPLIVNDLCAQLVPLNRYGLPALGAAVADGVRVLLSKVSAKPQRSYPAQGAAMSSHARSLVAGDESGPRAA
jgi:hypothetical protein